MYPLKFGKVVGRFVVVVADTADGGMEPEVLPMAGTVTFIPSARHLLAPAATPAPAFVTLDPIVAGLDFDGYLSLRDGERGVMLPVGAEGLNPDEWMWKASFDLHGAGHPDRHDEFWFELGEFLGFGDEVDLATVAAVPYAEPVGIIQGPRGPRGEPLNLLGTVADYAALAALPGPFGNNDAYVLESDGRLYAYQDGWPIEGDGAPFQGPQGPQGNPGPQGDPGDDGTNGTRGSLWSSGSGAPSGGSPLANDKYLNTSNGDVYNFNGSTWSVIGNIKGATGPEGPPGAIASSIVDGDTTHAPDGNSVFDALAGKANTSHTHTAANITDFTAAARAAVVTQTITNGVTATAPSEDVVFDALALKEAAANKGAASGYAPLDGSSKLPTANLPTVPIANGGTGQTTQAAALTALTGTQAAGQYVRSNGTNAALAAIQAADVPTLNQNTTGSAATLTTARTINGVSFNGSANITIPIPYDLCVAAFGKNTARAVGAGDFTMGMKLQRAVTFTSVTYRADTADASGNLVVELRKNGSAVSGTSATIAAANQVAGGTATGSWAFAAGDILTVYVTGVGTTPGKGLVADILGSA